MTTGRINQVCALPTEAMPCGRLHEEIGAAPPEDTYSVNSPKGSFGYALATGKYTKFVRPPKIAQGDNYAKSSVKVQKQESLYEQV